MNTRKRERTFLIVALVVFAIGFLGLLAGMFFPDTAHAQMSGTKEDSSEAGLSGWTIRLYDSLNPGNSDPIATTTTTEDGSYSVGNNLGSTTDYLVCEEDRSGWSQTEPTSGDGTATCPNGLIGYAETGTSSTNLTFRNEEGQSSDSSGGGDILQPRSEQEPEDGAIEGTKRNHDTEAGLSGWQISLHEFWSQSDGYDENPEATTTTRSDDPQTDEDEAGTYTFSDVAPGDYVVCEESRGSWQQTSPADEENTYECENGTTGHIVTVTEDGSVEGGNDFMNRERSGGSIHGTKRKYDDESGLSGWEIRLHDFWSQSDGYEKDPEKTVTTMKDDPETDTDESGMYWLEDVPFGDYLVCEEDRAGWTQTSPTAGEQTYQCENGTEGHVVSVTEEQPRSEGNDFMNRDEPGGGDEGGECRQFNGEEGFAEGAYDEDYYGDEGEFANREEHRAYCECVSEEGYDSGENQDGFEEEYDGDDNTEEQYGDDSETYGDDESDYGEGRAYCECVAEETYGQEEGEGGTYDEAGNSDEENTGAEGDYYNDAVSERAQCEQPGGEPDGGSPDGGSPDGTPGSSAPGLPDTGDGSLAASTLPVIGK